MVFDKNSFKDLKERAKKNNSDAQFQLAEIYLDGFHDNPPNKFLVKQNKRMAYLWFEKAAANGDISALNNLGNFLCNGIGCRKNEAKAIQIFKEAISKGSSSSAINLGTIYRDKGMYKIAFKYYLLAEKKNKADYSFLVGLCYYTGVGVLMDKKKAYKIFTKVAIDKLKRQTQYERDDANYFLGLSHITGEGVKKSLVKARKYLMLANRGNDHRSSEELLLLCGYPVKSDVKFVTHTS